MYLALGIYLPHEALGDFECLTGGHQASLDIVGKQGFTSGEVARHDY